MQNSDQISGVVKVKTARASDRLSYQTVSVPTSVNMSTVSLDDDDEDDSDFNPGINSASPAETTD